MSPPPRWLLWVLVLAVAAVAVGPALVSPLGMPGEGVDMHGTVWFYWYWGEVVAGRASPLHTDLFFFPFGKDLFSHTGANYLDAALAYPLRAVFGAERGYGLFIACILVANALAFRVLAADQLRDPWAVLGATLLFELNPYVLFELTQGRPTQGFVALLPLALWSLLHVHRSWARAALCGVLVALLGYGYWFYAYFFALCVGPLVLMHAWSLPPELRRRYASSLAAAAATSLALVLPALVLMASRAQSGAVPGVGGQGGWLEPAIVGIGVGSIHGWLPWEPTGMAYLTVPSVGLPLLLWLVVGERRRLWGGVLLLSLLLALGPTPQVAGTSLVNAPYVLLQHLLPFFERLWFPYRALALTMVVACLGAGFAGQWLRERLGSRGRWGLALEGVALLGAVAAGVLFAVFPLPVSQWPEQPVYGRMASLGGAVFDLPTGNLKPTIVYQTRHGMPLMGGMAEDVSLMWPEGHRLRQRQAAVRQLSKAVNDPLTPFKQRARVEPLLADGVRWVVLHRDRVEQAFTGPPGSGPKGMRHRAPFDVTERMSELLGPPWAVDGSLVVWSLDDAPGGDPDVADRLGVVAWELPQWTTWERRMHDLGRPP